MRLGLIVPTLTGRKAIYQRTIASLQRELDTYDIGSVICSPKDRPSLGQAWTEALRENQDKLSACDWLLLHADDATARPGWWPAALSCLSDGFLPAAEVYWGQTGSPVAIDGEPGQLILGRRGPNLLPRPLAYLLLPYPPLTCYVDCWLWKACELHGYRARYEPGFAFDNWDAQEGRANPEREQEFLELWTRLERQGLWSFRDAA